MNTCFDINDESAVETTTRVTRIQSLRAAGIEPYPATGYHPTSTVRDALLDQARLLEFQDMLSVAGRVIAIRSLGKSTFIDLLDDGTRIQVYVPASNDESPLTVLVTLIDVGDIIGVAGYLFSTKKGETSIYTSSVTVLAKAVHQIDIGKRTADGKFHNALSDKGRLNRERHVALITDGNLFRALEMRDKMMRGIRSYFHSAGFLEVETPVLSRQHGGAAARPFRTHIDCLDAEAFLRVSPECSLKRILCGGVNKIFEIGKNFRNEGIDHSHNPEFTAIEWYESWSDYFDQMRRFEELVSSLAETITGSTFVQFRGRTVDFTPPWPRLRVIEGVAEAFGVNEDALTDDFLLDYWRNRQDCGTHVPEWGEALMFAFENEVEPNLWGPVFVIDHPVENSPLTKIHRYDPRFVERFEPFVAGMEIGNAYSELNDPIEQRSRLVQQEASREEAYGVDEAFLRAVEDGMPQAGGAGLGIDRLLMILTDSKRLADVLMFPTV